MTPADSAGQRAVIVHPDPTTLARATAARLILALVDAQSVREHVHIAIAGGSVGTDVLAEVADSQLLDLVDLTAVHVWWVDERFVDTGTAERNDTQAMTALFGRIPIPTDNLHAMPAADEVASLDEASVLYAQELGDFAAPGLDQPVFDVVLLGMGPDGHIASLFPGHSSLNAGGLTVVEEASPKPPAQRISLTFDAINTSRQVWLAAWGEGKSAAVAAALRGDATMDCPAAGARGTEVTLWLLDAASAQRASPSQ